MNLAMTNAFKSSMQLDKRAPKLLGTTGGPPNSWILGNGKLTVCSKIFSFLCSPYKTENLLNITPNPSPNWPGVLCRLVPCIKDMELAC